VEPSRVGSEDEKPKDNAKRFAIELGAEAEVTAPVSPRLRTTF
jgi:hypothetical protein